MRKILAGLFALAFSIAPAAAQTGQLGAGQVWANPTGAQAPAIPSSVSALLDQALGSTRGAIIERGASGWVLIGPGATAGVPFISSGTGADPAYGISVLAGGGTGANLTASNGGVVWSNASQLQILAGTATARLPLLSGATATPAWGAFTLPASVTSGGVACYTSTSAQGSSVLLTANGLLIGGGAGACPGVLGSLGTTTTVLHGNAAGSPAFGSVVSGDLSITTTTCTNQAVTAISASASGTCSSITFAMIASSEVATQAQYFAGTASKLVQSGVIYNAEIAVTFGTTTTFDFSTFVNASVTLTANITTQTLTNVIAGKAGSIRFIQSGAGSFTTVWNSTFKFSGGSTPALTTGSTTAVDILSYNCISATFCQASLAKDVR